MNIIACKDVRDTLHRKKSDETLPEGKKKHTLYKCMNGSEAECILPNPNMPMNEAIIINKPSDNNTSYQAISY